MLTSKNMQKKTRQFNIQRCLKLFLLVTSENKNSCISWQQDCKLCKNHPSNPEIWTSNRKRQALEHFTSTKKTHLPCSFAFSWAPWSMDCPPAISMIRWHNGRPGYSQDINRLENQRIFIEIWLIGKALPFQHSKAFALAFLCGASHVAVQTLHSQAALCKVLAPTVSVEMFLAWAFLAATTIKVGCSSSGGQMKCTTGKTMFWTMCVLPEPPWPSSNMWYWYTRCAFLEHACFLVRRPYPTPRQIFG